MERSVSLSELLGAYWAHFTSYDGLIVALGTVTLLSQVALCLWGRAALLRPKGEIPFLRKMALKLFDRLCSSVVEVFTLLGLLGTVFSLLYTFTGIDSDDTQQVLRSFAPAFTATISGLLAAISNKLVYDAALSPLLEELFALEEGEAHKDAKQAKAPKELNGGEPDQKTAPPRLATGTDEGSALTVEPLKDKEP
jgi:hypothetical protein